MPCAISVAFSTRLAVRPWPCSAVVSSTGIDASPGDDCSMLHWRALRRSAPEWQAREEAIHEVVDGAVRREWCMAIFGAPFAVKLERVTARRVAVRLHSKKS